MASVFGLCAPKHEYNSYNILPVCLLHEKARWRSGALVITVALQQEGSWFEPAGQLGELACSPCVCVQTFRLIPVAVNVSVNGCLSLCYVLIYDR